MQRLAVAVFLGSLGILGFQAATPDIATSYVDPVAKIQAQDEAVYGSTSFNMAEHGDWLTPRFLGRYALYKPPLLYWLSAASAELMGKRPIALRFPSLLAGAATVALVFRWLVLAGLPITGALAGAVLLLSSHLFFVLSRTGLTDALLTFEIAAAMMALGRDPRLKSDASLWIFSIATGAALMTKGLAGLLPLAVLAIFSAISRERPPLGRIGAAVALALLLAAPWHLYQLAVHPKWFWTEYVLTEQGAWAFSAPGQTTQESHFGFYLKRLIFLDPVLLAAAVFALTRSRPRLLLAWIVAIAAAVLAFQYRNVAYLMPALPALAVLAAGAIPKQFSLGALTLSIALLATKAAFPAQPWGIPLAPESVNPSHAMLDRYAGLNRGNSLILVDPDDQFYSACLDLPRVRYLFLDPSGNRPKLPLDFEALGIVVTAADFNRLPELQADYEKRLRDWGLDAGNPIATTILARTPDEVAALIQSHPEADFFASEAWGAADQGHHDIARFKARPGAPPNGPAREFLLSREVIQRP